MAILQIRNVDMMTKKEAEKVFEKMGITVSGAVKLFLNQVAMTKTIPFQPTTLTLNGLAEQEEEEIVQAVRDAEQGLNVSLPLGTQGEVQAYLDHLKKKK